MDVLPQDGYTGHDLIQYGECRNRAGDVKMELYQLKYVLTLAEELNFSKAAQRLYITQSALSQQIKKLEKELGIYLFERDTKSVTLSPDGKEFIEYAKRICAEYESMQRWLAVRVGPNANISFGVSEYTSRLVSAGIEEFRAMFPSVQVSLVQERPPALIDMVKYDTLDVAFVGLPENRAIRSGLRVFPVRDEYVCAVVSENHFLHDRKSVPIQELANEKIIMRSNTSRIYFEIMNEFKRAGAVPDISVVEDFERQFSMIKDGAVTFAKSNAIMYTGANLIMIRVEPEISTEFALIVSENRKLSPMENSFIRAVHNSLLNSVTESH